MARAFIGEIPCKGPILFVTDYGNLDPINGVPCPLLKVEEDLLKANIVFGEVVLL